MKKESVDARAGRLLARTRTQAKLTQAEVATRAELPQSTVSAYESGRRQPTLPMLSKLLEAMGAELTIAASPLPAGLTGLTGTVGVRIRRHRQLITEAATGYGAQNVRVLDVAATPVELLVDRSPEATPPLLLDLAAALQEIIGAPVKIIASEDLSSIRKADAERRSLAL